MQLDGFDIRYCVRYYPDNHDPVFRYDAENSDDNYARKSFKLYGKSYILYFIANEVGTVAIAKHIKW